MNVVSHKCPACRADNLPDAAFCDQCGTALTRPCPSCQFSNRAIARFCRACGHAIFADTAVTPPPPPVPEPAPEQEGPSSADEDTELHTERHDMLAFHRKAQYIIYFQGLCGFVATGTLCIEVTANPTGINIFIAFAGAVPNVHASEMRSVGVRVAYTV